MFCSVEPLTQSNVFRYYATIRLSDNTHHTSNSTFGVVHFEVKLAHHVVLKYRCS